MFLPVVITGDSQGFHRVFRLGKDGKRKELSYVIKLRIIGMIAKGDGFSILIGEVDNRADQLSRGGLFPIADSGVLEHDAVHVPALNGIFKNPCVEVEVEEVSQVEGICRINDLGPKDFPHFFQEDFGERGEIESVFLGEIRRHDGKSP